MSRSASRSVSGSVGYCMGWLFSGLVGEWISRVGHAAVGCVGGSMSNKGAERCVVGSVYRRGGRWDGLAG